MNYGDAQGEIENAITKRVFQNGSLCHFEAFRLANIQQTVATAK
jgi:hypothetical protein